MNLESALRRLRSNILYDIIKIQKSCKGMDNVTRRIQFLSCLGKNHVLTLVTQIGTVYMQSDWSVYPLRIPEVISPLHIQEVILPLKMRIAVC